MSSWEPEIYHILQLCKNSCYHTLQKKILGFHSKFCNSKSSLQILCYPNNNPYTLHTEALSWRISRFDITTRNDSVLSSWKRLVGGEGKGVAFFRDLFFLPTNTLSVYSVHIFVPSSRKNTNVGDRHIGGYKGNCIMGWQVPWCPECN